MPKRSAPARNSHMDEHRMDALIEDVIFLLDTGVSIDLICVRLDKKKDTVENIFRRRSKQPPWVPKSDRIDA